jgi:hypothetical protein
MEFIYWLRVNNIPLKLRTVYLQDTALSRQSLNILETAVHAIYPVWTVYPANNLTVSSLLLDPSARMDGSLVWNLSRQQIKFQGSPIKLGPVV